MHVFLCVPPMPTHFSKRFGILWQIFEISKSILVSFMIMTTRLLLMTRAHFMFTCFQATFQGIFAKLALDFRSIVRTRYVSIIKNNNEKILPLIYLYILTGGSSSVKTSTTIYLSIERCKLLDHNSRYETTELVILVSKLVYKY